MQGVTRWLSPLCELPGKGSGFPGLALQGNTNSGREGSSGTGVGPAVLPSASCGPRKALACCSLESESPRTMGAEVVNRGLRAEDEVAEEAGEKQTHPSASCGRNPPTWGR